MTVMKFLIILLSLILINNFTPVNCILGLKKSSIFFGPRKVYLFLLVPPKQYSKYCQCLPPNSYSPGNPWANGNTPWWWAWTTTTTTSTSTTTTTTVATTSALYYYYDYDNSATSPPFTGFSPGSFPGIPGLPGLPPKPSFTPDYYFNAQRKAQSPTIKLKKKIKKKKIRRPFRPGIGGPFMRPRPGFAPMIRKRRPNRSGNGQDFWLNNPGGYVKNPKRIKRSKKGIVAWAFDSVRSVFVEILGIIDSITKYFS